MSGDVCEARKATSIRVRGQPKSRIDFATRRGVIVTIEETACRSLLLGDDCTEKPNILRGVRRRAGLGPDVETPDA